MNTKIFKTRSRTLKAFNHLVPEDIFIYNELESIGYESYLPITFLTDMLIIGKCLLLHIELKDLSDYEQSIFGIVNSNRPVYLIRDIVRILKRFSDNYDLRTIELYANEGKLLELSSIDESFNYKFCLKDIDENIIKLLDISEDEINQVKKMDDDIISILTLATGIGTMNIPSISYNMNDDGMTKYSDIVKITAHKFADPLFNYKFSIKAYDIRKEISIEQKSDKLVIGYFLNSISENINVKALYKLIGVIALMYSNNINIILYSFFGNTFNKYHLKNVQEIIEFFNKDIQLKLFPIDNTKALEYMISENKGDDIVFIPNTNRDCVLKYGSRSGRINIISSKLSKYNIRFSNICKKTGGMFITV